MLGMEELVMSYLDGQGFRCSSGRKEFVLEVPTSRGLILKYYLIEQQECGTSTQHRAQVRMCVT